METCLRSACSLSGAYRGGFAAWAPLIYSFVSVPNAPIPGGEESVASSSTARPPSPPRPVGVVAVALLCGLTVLGVPMGEPRPAARAADTDRRAGDEEAIRATAKAYRDALAKGDAAAVAEMWTADADIVDGLGAVVAASAPAAFGGGPAAGPRPQVTLGPTTLRFVTPDVAIEDGRVDVTPPGAVHPVEGQFSAIWVRQGAAWKLAGLREAERPVVDGPQSIDDLGWMVGDWELIAAGDADPGAPAVRMSVAWDAGRAFLLRDLRLPTMVDDVPAEVLVHQRVGWDPVLKRIRSWTFSTDGAIGEATWTRDGGSWVARGVMSLPDGVQKAATNIYTYDGKDHFTWRTLPDATGAEQSQEPVTWVRTTAGEEQR